MGQLDNDALKMDATAQNIPPHAPIAHKAEEGVLEGRRAVMFKKEMTYPSKSIALQKGQRNQPGVARCSRGDQQDQADT